MFFPPDHGHYHSLSKRHLYDIHILFPIILNDNKNDLFHEDNKKPYTSPFSDVIVNTDIS